MAKIPKSLFNFAVKTQNSEYYINYEINKWLIWKFYQENTKIFVILITNIIQILGLE